MPAVPSGRACEACRNVRKKCDSGVPTCGRCTRLNVACVGSGQRRFLFKGPKCHRKPSFQIGQRSELYKWPTDPADGLSASLLRTISPETEPRFSLLQSYGPFLKYLPQRLGKSEALDSATRALVLAHRDICSKRNVSLPTTLAYATAISKLKLALGDHEEASSVHSLASATLLVICRDLNGTGIQDWSIHSQGAADIVQARRHLQAQDELERQLLWSLQGYVVGHCVLFRDMRLNPTRFEKLVVTLGENLPPGSFVHFIFNIPRLIERGNSLCGDFQATQELNQEVLTAYRALTSARHELRKLLDTKLVLGSSSRDKSSREYAFILTLCSIYYCMLRGLKSVENSLVFEENDLIQATLDLATDMKDLSPLGSMFMFLPLFAACLATEDADTMELVKNAIWNLEQDYHRNVQIESMVQRMEELRWDLNFEKEDSSTAGPGYPRPLSVMPVYRGQSGLMARTEVENQALQLQSLMRVRRGSRESTERSWDNSSYCRHSGV